MDTRYCRFTYNGRVLSGVTDGTHVYPNALGHQLPTSFRDASPVPIEEVTLLAPVDPSKVVLLSKNYRTRLRATGTQQHPEPLIFFKPASAVVGPGGVIRLPQNVGDVSCEVELAIVMCSGGGRITAADASQRVLGLTVLLDISARDLVAEEGELARGKGFDTFCPIGPTITAASGFEGGRIELYQNGDLVNVGETDDMVVDPWHCVEFVSSQLTLNPGDVIATGGAGPDRPLLAPGDSLEARVDGLDPLRVSVV